MRQNPLIFRLCNSLVILGLFICFVALFLPPAYLHRSNNDPTIINTLGYDLPQAIHDAKSFPDLLFYLLPLLPLLLLLTLTLLRVTNPRRFQRFQSLQWVSLFLLGLLLLCNASLFFDVLIHGQPSVGPGLILLLAGFLLALFGLTGLSLLPWHFVPKSTSRPKN